MARKWHDDDGTMRVGGNHDEECNGWSRGQKEVRILDVLEPLVNTLRLVVDRSVIESDERQQMKDGQYSLIWQMTRMERAKDALPHEDRLEAVAIAATYWVEKMDRDRDKAIETMRREALTKELEKWGNIAKRTHQKPVRRVWAGYRWSK